MHDGDEIKLTYRYYRTTLVIAAVAIVFGEKELHQRQFRLHFHAEVVRLHWEIHEVSKHNINNFTSS